MTQFSSHACSAVGAWVLAAGLALLSACANVPFVAGTNQVLREPEDLQTGSNLSRRDKPSTGAREMDKSAIESGLRGTHANRDTGR